MEAILAYRRCAHCGAVNYTKLDYCLLCRQAFEALTDDFSEHPTLHDPGKDKSAWLEVVSGPVETARVPLLDKVRLGRSGRNQVQILSDQASREHAEILLTRDGRWLLSDLGTTNGTYLNGSLINGPAALNPGDEIEIGEAVFRFKQEEV
jgi:FHA domain